MHLPIPVFTYTTWLRGLIAGIALLLLLSPAAFAGAGWIRVVALLLAILVGMGNALLHLVSSAIARRPMAGVLSSPVLLAAGGWLAWSCWQP